MFPYLAGVMLEVDIPSASNGPARALPAFPLEGDNPTLDLSSVWGSRSVGKDETQGVCATWSTGDVTLVIESTGGDADKNS